MFLYNLDDLGKEVVDRFEEFLKNDMWLEGIPGGFVTNSPKRQVNAYGDGTSYNNNKQVVEEGWDKTYWTAKMSQNNITLESKPKSLPQEFLNLVPKLRKLFKVSYEDANITPNTFNIGVCNYYTKPDMYIAAHTDDNVWYPRECGEGPVFASITLYPHGTPEKLARFQVKEDGKWIDVPLKHRTVLIMPSNIEHRVLKYKKSDEKYFKPRINITFRSTYSRKENVLMNAMAVSNHTRYYGTPSKLIFPDGMDLEIARDILEPYVEFCEKYKFVLSVQVYKKDKTKFRKRWIQTFKDNNSIKFKIMNNMVGELFRMLCKS